MKKTSESSSGAMKLFKIGAGLASVAAAVYFLLGSKSKKEKAQVKSWAIKMKGDIIEKLETAHDISEPVYNKIIDTVAAKYEKELKSSPKEIRELAADLKKHWQTISKSLVEAKSDIASTTKKIKTKQLKKEKTSVKV